MGKSTISMAIFHVKKNPYPTPISTSCGALTTSFFRHNLSFTTVYLAKRHIRDRWGFSAPTIMKQDEMMSVY